MASLLDRVRRGRQPERAATLVEYALLVALLAVPTIGGISMLQDGAAAKSNSSAEGISSRTIPPTSAVAGPTVPTTAPTTVPTTVPPPTTTTTTAAPTTTTAPPTQSTSTWGSMTTAKEPNNTRWRASNTLTIRDNYGFPVSGATVTIKVEYRTTTTGSGGWTTVTPNLVATTGANGVLTIDSGLYRMSAGIGSPPLAAQIRFSVVSVVKSGLTWQSNTTPVTATRPN